MRSDRLGLLLAATAVAFGSACSSSAGKGATSNSGGSTSIPGTGGLTGQGGTTGSGGSPGTGGASGNGGAIGTGGRPASGGSISTGGASASGGAAGQVGGGGSSSPGTGGGGRGDGGPGLAGRDGSGGGGSPGSGGSSGSGGGSGSGGSSGSGGTSRTGDGGAPIDSGGTKPTTCSPSSSTLAKGDSTRTIQVGGLSRTYLLHVPSSYTGTSPVPFVIDFHGMGDTPDGQKRGSGFLALSDSNGFLVAWPTGIDKAWNFGPCCTCSKTVDDLGFAKAMVAEVESLACIDAKRVYANGFSIGGAMTNYVACNGADVFAAATPSASDLLGSNQTPCNPVRPISVLAFRGTADATVPYTGAKATTPNSCPATLDLLGAVASFNKWAEIDGCTGTPTTTNVTNPSGTQMLYTQCAGGVEVGLYTIQGGGHSPGPGTVAWNFLKTKSLP